MQVATHTARTALQKRTASATMNHLPAIHCLLQQLRNITCDPQTISNFQTSLESYFGMSAVEDLNNYRLQQALDVSNALLEKQPQTDDYNETYVQPADLDTAVRPKLVLMDSWNRKIKLSVLKEVARQIKYMELVKKQMRQRHKAAKQARLAKLPLKLRFKLENKQEAVKRKNTIAEDGINAPKKLKLENDNKNNSNNALAANNEMVESVQPIHNIATYRPIRPNEEVIEAPVVEHGSYLKPTPKPKRPKNSPPTPMPEFIRTLSTSGKDMIVIGPNGTTISRSAFATLNWSLSDTAIARKLLVEVFDRQTLAFCSLTGKPSPAFLDMNKPKKDPLDEKKVEDLTYLLTEMLNMTRHEVRIAITTKCADENKMYRQRMKKRQEMEALLLNSKAMQ